MATCWHNSPPRPDQNMASPAEPTVREIFTAFLEGWLVRQEAFLEKLQILSSVPLDVTEEKDEERRHFVERILAHYQQYYEEKIKAAKEDVFLMFSPPWLSSFERALLWISGFKPSMLFPLLNGLVGDFKLSAEQFQRIEMVKAETRREERKIADEMARIQESVAAPPIFNFMRKMGRLVDGEVSELNTAVEGLKAAMVVVMGDADNLRDSTVRKIVEILNPLQTVKILAGAAEFQLQARRWGMQRDSERRNTEFE
ncbi:unnamed protein product [Ilex paraguariensis]|uniref:DOG1 domain-containing protein n=1 Tax=Ilex paraguariensis TaxID=185542 RepID=A0ABC8TZW2_9AQUA